MSSHGKLAFVIPSLTWGGAELQLIKQTKLLKDNGYDPHLIVLGDQLDLIEEVDLDKSHILLLGISAGNHLNQLGVFRSFFASWSILRYLRSKKIKIVIGVLPFAHWVSRLTTITGWFVFYKIYLFQYHKSEQFRANPINTTAKKIYHKCNSVLAWLCDYGSIFISRAVFQDISKKQFVRRPEVVYNFIEEKNIDELKAREYLQGRNKPFKTLLLIPGRLHPVKGQQFFLNATKAWLTPSRMEKDEILLVMTGGGLEEEKIRSLIAELGISKHIVITGFVENNLVLSFMKLADLVIIPSLYEGLGNVAIEAIMLKKKILSSDAGGLKEILADCNSGMLFQTGNAMDLQRKFIEAMDGRSAFDPESGYTLYREKFTPQIHIRNFIHVLQSVER